MVDGKNMQSNFFIGTQLSSAKGFKSIGTDALAIGAATFQFFMRNPRGTKAKAINPGDIAALNTILRENHFGKILAHGPYTLNACSRDAHLRELSGEMFADDLERMEHLPGNYYNLHPGSRQGQDMETAVEYISKMIRENLSRRHRTTVLLETMSGKGSEVGSRFEELSMILEKTAMPEKMGVCFDACHLWDSGYDIVNDLDGVLEEFDRIIGLSFLKAFHINDSKNERGSRKDRHAVLGGGCIGLEAIVSIVNHPKLRHLPFITETPLDLEGHKAEIALLKSRFVSG